MQKPIFPYQGVLIAVFGTTAWINKLCSACGEQPDKADIQQQ